MSLFMPVIQTFNTFNLGALQATYINTYIYIYIYVCVCVCVWVCVDAGIIMLIPVYIYIYIYISLYQSFKNKQIVDYIYHSMTTQKLTTQKCTSHGLTRHKLTPLRKKETKSNKICFYYKEIYIHINVRCVISGGCSAPLHWGSQPMICVQLQSPGRVVKDLPRLVRLWGKLDLLIGFTRKTFLIIPWSLLIILYDWGSSSFDWQGSVREEIHQINH